MARHLVGEIEATRPGGISVAEIMRRFREQDTLELGTGTDETPSDDATNPEGVVFLPGLVTGEPDGIKDFVPDYDEHGQPVVPIVNGVAMMPQGIEAATPSRICTVVQSYILTLLRKTAPLQVVETPNGPIMHAFPERLLVRRDEWAWKKRANAGAKQTSTNGTEDVPVSITEVITPDVQRLNELAHPDLAVEQSGYDVRRSVFGRFIARTFRGNRRGLSAITISDSDSHEPISPEEAFEADGNVTNGHQTVRDSEPTQSIGFGEVAASRRILSGLVDMHGDAAAEVAPLREDDDSAMIYASLVGKLARLTFVVADRAIRDDESIAA